MIELSIALIIGAVLFIFCCGIFADFLKNHESLKPEDKDDA
jgi:hypothetical protein